MGLLLTAPPGVEPVSVADAKAYLRISADDEDALLATLTASARQHVERSCGLALIAQGWTLVLDAWPGSGIVRMPLAPIAVLDEVRVHDAHGGNEVIPPSEYIVDTVSRPARLVVTGARPKPGRNANAIEIAFTAGFGDAPDDVPEPIRQALLLLVAHGFERREPVAADGASDVPMTVAALLAPWREMRL